MNKKPTLTKVPKDSAEASGVLLIIYQTKP